MAWLSSHVQPSPPAHQAASLGHVFALLRALLAWVVWFFAAVPAAGAQEMEPRSYSNAPVGVNFLIAGYGYTQGGFPTDTGLPVTDPKLDTSNTVFAYARSVELWGKSAKFDAIVPYTWLSGTAMYQGQPVERVANGPGDPLVRCVVHLYGGPPRAAKG